MSTYVAHSFVNLYVDDCSGETKGGRMRVATVVGVKQPVYGVDNDSTKLHSISLIVWNIDKNN